MVKRIILSLLLLVSINLGTTSLPAIAQEGAQQGNYEEVVKLDHGFSKFKKNGKWGLMYKEKEVIAPEYNSEDFVYLQPGYYQYKKNDKWGLIYGDNIVFQPVNDKYEYIINGYFRFKQNDKWGLLREGEIILKPEYKNTDIAYLGGHNIGFRKNNKWGLITENTITIKPTYENPREVYKHITSRPGSQRPNLAELAARTPQTNWYSKGYSSFKKDDKVGLRFNDKVVLEPIYDSILYEQYKYYKFKKDGKWGLLKETKIVLPPEYDEIKVLGRRSIKLLKNGKYKLFDGESSITNSDGEPVHLMGKYYKIQKKGKWGISDGTTILIEPIYDSINLFYESHLISGAVATSGAGEYFVTQKGSKRGLIKGGKLILDAEYDRINREEGYILFHGNSGWGVVYDDTVILQAQYREVVRVTSQDRFYSTYHYIIFRANNGLYGLIYRDRIIFNADCTRITMQQNAPFLTYTRTFLHMPAEWGIVNQGRITFRINILTIIVLFIIFIHLYIFIRRRNAR